MKVRIRFMELEIINFWRDDPADYDEVQRTVVIDCEKLPEVGELISIETKVFPLEVIKVTQSNGSINDGIDAYVEAKVKT